MATEEEYNEQLAAALTEGTGTTITAGHLSPTDASNRLSAGEVQRRFELGLPINEGEMFPAIPEGITAWDYYKYSNIPAPMTAFSTTFSNFENSIALSQNPQSANTVSDQQKIDDSIKIDNPIQNYRRREVINPTTGTDDEHSSIYYEENRAKAALRARGLGVQMPGAVPGFGTLLKGGVGRMLLKGASDALSLFKGEIAESAIMPSLDDPDYNTILNDMIASRDLINGFRLDRHTVENLELLQIMGYGTSYHIDKDGVITPNSKYAVGQEQGSWDRIEKDDWTFWGGSGESGKGDTGLPDVDFWKDAYASSQWDIPTGSDWQDPTWSVVGGTPTSGYLSRQTGTFPGPQGGGSAQTTQTETGLSKSDQYTPNSARIAYNEYIADLDDSGFFGDSGYVDHYDAPMGVADFDDLEQEGHYLVASGGPIPPSPQMPPQQEGMEAPMPMPQEGAAADMANLGMINEQGAAPPQEGGQASVQDDVPREADEGDYILPYETVLLVGLKQLNRYAREAIKLAMKNDIDLAGTDLDPTDDVPIKVSNYEFHIPKVLVPFFGGGKKYLDKIREEGLALRKRLEEEKQPSAEQQQPQPTAQPAPPQLEAAPAAPPQAGPPMMQKGGFVLDPNEGQQQQTPTTAAVLESDTSQPTQESAAYNQVQAMQRAEKTKQQPLMVDPTGKVIPQGFAAPQGYQDGTSEGGVQKGEVRKIFGYDFNILEDEEFKGESGTNVDFLHPDEPQNSSGMPTIIIKDRAKLGEQVGDIDNFLKGEALHYLASVDPKYSGLRDDYKKSLTSGQKAMDKSAFERAKQQGESRPFSKWMETHRLDAHIRGALYQDTKDEWAGSYTPEQNQILETIKNHLSTLEAGPIEQPSQPELVAPVTDVLPPPQEDILPLPEEKEEVAIPALPDERQPGFAQQPMIA